LRKPVVLERVQGYFRLSVFQEMFSCIFFNKSCNKFFISWKLGKMFFFFSFNFISTVSEIISS